METFDHYSLKFSVLNPFQIHGMGPIACNCPCPEDTSDDSQELPEGDQVLRLQIVKKRSEHNPKVIIQISNNSLFHPAILIIYGDVSK